MSEYLDIPAGVGNYASTPNHTSLQVTGAMTLIADVAMDDWSPPAVNTLISKWHTTSNQRSYGLDIGSDGRPRLLLSSGGTSANVIDTASVAPSISDGTRLAIRADVVPNNGSGQRTSTFYTAPSAAGPWTQLGNVLTGTATAVFDGTADLLVGAKTAGTAEAMSGRVYGTQVIAGGFNGTVVANPSFANQSIGVDSFEDSTGKVWTMNGVADLGPLDEEPPDLGSDYQLVFEDEFDNLDTSVWNVHPWDDWPTDTFDVANGILTINSPGEALTTLGPRDGEFPTYYPDAVSFHDGYFEARIRYTADPAISPAFWAMGIERLQRWPNLDCEPHIVQAEWDIMENFIDSSDPQDFHAAAHRNTGDSCGVARTSRSFHEHMDVDPEEWHVYSGLWKGNRLTSYVDGTRMGVLETFDSFDQELYMILSLASASPGPEMQIDWVRVWQS